MSDTSCNYAIFPGSFDPIHNGHIELAEHACLHYGWEHVYLIPSSHFHNRPVSPQLSGDWRLRLCRAALDERPATRLRLLGHEITDHAPGYLIDTVRTVHKRFGNDGGADEEWRVRVILGSDLLTEIGQWKAIDELVQRVHFYFFSRPSDTEPFSTAILEQHRFHYTFCPTPPYFVSSSDVRQRTAVNESIADLVPSSVAEIIAANHLYRATDLAIDIE